MQHLKLLLALTAAVLMGCAGSGVPVPDGSFSVKVGEQDIMMINVEPGQFTMGATSEHTDCDFYSEKPEHPVNITRPYLISQTEVTQEVYQAVMGSNPSLYKGQEGETHLPVVNVTWYDAQEFCTRLAQITHQPFRLPTEAEWEYAARGADKGYSLPYAGSKYCDRVAAMRDNALGHPHPVAQYGPNEIAVYDMSGNVWEWVQDNYQVYHDTLYTNPLVVTNDTLPHTVRGGAFNEIASRCRTATRDNFPPRYRQTNLGFRVAMTKEE